MYVACIIFIYPAITAYQLLKAERTHSIIFMPIYAASAIKGGADFIQSFSCRSMPH